MSVKELSERALFTGASSAHEATFRALVEGESPLAHFDRPRSASLTRLAVVSDPHVSVDANGTWKMYHRTRARFLEALADIEQQGADALVIAGDLTKDGERRNLDWIQSTRDNLTVPVLAVPGNHDVKEEHVAYFEKRFTDGGFPVHVSLDGLDVLGLNSAMDPNAETLDIVSNAQIDWLDETLPNTTDPIVVTHHNLPGLHDHIGEHGWAPHPPVGNAEALLDVLSRHDVPLHLSGHVHLLSLVHNRGVRGLIAPPLSSFPQAYTLLDIDATGTTVHCRTTASQDDMEEAYSESQTHSVRSEVISGLNAEQLRHLPLVDERVDAAGDIRPIQNGKESPRVESDAPRNVFEVENPEG